MDSFPSKVDAWFLALFWGSALLMFVGAPFAARKAKWAGALLVVTGVAFAGVGFSALQLRYDFHDDGWVHSDGGFLPGGPIVYAPSVVAVAPSRDARSAPAASLDRLRIDWVDGAGQRRVTLVSPKDKDGFIAALEKRRDER